MPATATATIDELICESVKQTDEANLRGKYSDQDEFVIVDEFLPQGVLNRCCSDFFVALSAPR